MNLVTPDFGLLFWMVLSFAILLFILKKFAWKPVLKMIKEREESIAKQLDSAKAAKEQSVRRCSAMPKPPKIRLWQRHKTPPKLRLIRLLPQHVWKFKPKKTRLWPNFLKRWDNFRLKLPKKFSAANSATKPSKATL